MKKIPTLFVRNPEDRRYVTDEVTPGCEWVLSGEGVATRKYDGTCVMLDDAGDWWARREVKPGKTPPPGWTQADHDETTGKSVGWEPIAQSSFAKFHAEAVANVLAVGMSFAEPGTYELIGPKINGNPEGEEAHRLVRHGRDLSPSVVLTFERLRGHVTMLASEGIEGIVWHHPDGRMAKLKGRDFPKASR